MNKEESKLLWIEIPIDDVLRELSIKGFFPDRDWKDIWKDYCDKYHMGTIKIGTSRATAVKEEKL